MSTKDLTDESGKPYPLLYMNIYRGFYFYHDHLMGILLEGSCVNELAYPPRTGPLPHRHSKRIISQNLNQTTKAIPCFKPPLFRISFPLRKKPGRPTLLRPPLKLKTRFTSIAIKNPLLHPFCDDIKFNLGSNNFYSPLWVEQILKLILTLE